MYTYDKELRNKRSQKKAIVGFITINVVAVLLLFVNVWLYCDLLKQNVNLSLKVSRILTEDTLLVVLSFVIITIIWYVFGENFKLFEYRHTYPVIGTAVLNIVLLLNINSRAFECLIVLLTKLLGVFRYIMKNPILLIVSIVALLIVIFKWLLFTILDIIYEIRNMLSWHEIRKNLPRMIIYYAVYHFSILGLGKLNNSLFLVAGTVIVMYAMYLLWNLNIMKYYVSNEEVLIKGRKKRDSIILRIFKDIMVGISITVAIYCSVIFLYSNIFKRWFDLMNIKITDFDVQEIFFTELSLVFLVISFVTLLANKTETVYWVDVIQYRLVKPNRTSIVDISSYIFANLILSLLAFVFPALNNIMLISFVITIILLGFLSFKLLISFFGVDHLKDELKKEYQMALEYRKLICVLQEMSKRSIQIDVLKTPSEYAEHGLGEFGSRLQIDTNELQNLQDSLLRNEEGFGIHSNKWYRKFLYYAKRFEYRVYQYEIMRDGLYSNVLRCIDEFRINEIGEQILFLLQYKEYEYAYDCIKKVMEQCPIAFLDMFDESFDEIPKDEDLIGFLYQVLLDLRENPDNTRLLKSAKYKNAIMCFITWADKDLEQEKEEILRNCLAQRKAPIVETSQKEDN